jgi:hypothetical protein
MVYLILRKTPIGEMAHPITQQEINVMTEAGTIQKLPDGMYREIEAPVSVEADKVEKPKRAYKRKDMIAEGDGQ